MDNIVTVFNFSSLILIPMGLAGNTLMYIVFSRRALHRLSLSIYFRCIAIVNLYITLNWLKLFLVNQYNYFIISQSIFLCKLVPYLIYCAGPISGWLLVMVSVDVFLKIAFPTRFQQVHQLKYQIGIITTIFIYNMAYYFQIIINLNLVVPQLSSSSLSLFTNDTSNNLTIMRFSDDEKSQCFGDFHTLFILDFLNNAMFPFLFMIVLSVMTTLFVLKSRQKIETRTKRTRKRDFKFSITIIVVNVVFLVLNAPSPFYNAVTFFYNIDETLDNMLGTFFIAFYYSYYALIFYLQLCVNSLVRKEFRALLNVLLLRLRQKNKIATDAVDDVSRRNVNRMKSTIPQKSTL